MLSRGGDVIDRIVGAAPWQQLQPWVARHLQAAREPA
jgi:hypothetical protein